MIMTDGQKLKLEFWNQFRKYLITNNLQTKTHKPRPEHFFDIFPFNTREVHIALCFFSKRSKTVCRFYIPNDKQLYSNLLANRYEIESMFGQKIFWHNPSKYKCSYIELSRSIDDPYDKGKWVYYFDWMIEATDYCKKVFEKYISIHCKR